MKRNYKYEYICESNGDLRANINRLKELGYKYIVKATDKWLSGWSGTITENRKHIQLIACYDNYELDKILADGAVKARAVAEKTIERVKRAMLG